MKKVSGKRVFNIILKVLIALMLAAIIGFIVWLVVGGVLTSFDATKDKATATPGPALSTPEPDPTEEPTEEPAETPEPTEEPVTFTDVKVVAVGDVMVYESMWVRAKKFGGGEYDFSELTQYVKDIVSSADYAIFNYEGTCAGADRGYTAYPQFSAPDNIITTMKNTGFDASGFTNNHIYDKGHAGFLRTQQVMKDNGLTVLGAKTYSDEKSYTVVDVGGVKLGLLSYTYESGTDEIMNDPSRKSLNWNEVDKSDTALIDSFNSTRMEVFYSEITSRVNELNAEGADLIIVYMHWGEEYQETATSQQRAIAANLCEIGVNVIFGMHPHVVENVETFVSQNGKNRMLCYYSLGNFTSAQNRDTFQSKPSYAWLTENELMAEITVRKYSTGETLIANASYRPMWNHRYSTDSWATAEHNVIPLDLALVDNASKEAYGLNRSSYGVKNATAAKEYIDAKVAPGIEEYNAGIVLLHQD